MSEFKEVDEGFLVGGCGSHLVTRESRRLGKLRHCNETLLAKWL